MRRTSPTLRAATSPAAALRALEEMFRGGEADRRRPASARGKADGYRAGAAYNASAKP